MESQNGWSISISLHIKHPMEDQGRPDLPDLCTTCLLQNSTEIPCGVAVSYLLYLPIMQEASLAVLFYYRYISPICNKVLYR